MQLEEIPFIWMAGCLGNCSRASNSFQQRKIIGWIPASDWADDQGSLPSRLSFTLVPLSQQRCARGGWVCLWVQATRNRPSGKGRSRNSVEPVVLTLSDSLGGLHECFEVRLVIPLWNANPRVPRLLLFSKTGYGFPRICMTRATVLWLHWLVNRE